MNKQPIFLHATIIIILVSLYLTSCTKDDFPTKVSEIEKLIVAAKGDTLNTDDNILLIIPPGALAEDGNVFLGVIGGPESVPNSNLKIASPPITLRFPGDHLTKPVRLEIPLGGSVTDTSNCIFYMFNGNSYFPISSSVENNNHVLIIDELDWEVDGEKGSLVTSEIIVLALMMEQTPSSLSMGLKRITLNSTTHELQYFTPVGGVNSRILLLVHGWTGSPTVWDEFLPKLLNEQGLEYTDYWTFGYNSSWSIDYNGELMSEAVKNYSNGAQIDIVAHSMGGLVSRAMIENHDGYKYIRKLITLGTPHEGSPLAVFRYILGAIVAMDNPFALPIYNYNSQGFRDLNTNSSFISKLKLLSAPPVPYFTIACTNDPSLSTLSKYVSGSLLPGPDDGIVTIASAHGVSGDVIPGYDINILDPWAHLKMTRNDQIYNQVLTYLSTVNSSYKWATINLPVGVERAHGITHIPGDNTRRFVTFENNCYILNWDFTYTGQSFKCSQIDPINTQDGYWAFGITADENYFYVNTGGRQVERYTHSGTFVDIFISHSQLVAAGFSADYNFSTCDITAAGNELLVTGGPVYHADNVARFNKLTGAFIARWESSPFVPYGICWVPSIKTDSFSCNAIGGCIIVSQFGTDIPTDGQSGNGPLHVYSLDGSVYYGSLPATDYARQAGLDYSEYDYQGNKHDLVLYQGHFAHTQVSTFIIE